MHGVVYKSHQRRRHGIQVAARTKVLASNPHAIFISSDVAATRGRQSKWFGAFFR